MTIEPLTKRELVKYFQVYREAFPDWKVEHKVMLTRCSGPISQHIPFQNLSYGAYRPSCSIWVAGPPDGSQLLWQFLDVKHRQVERRQHDTKWPSVLKAMEEQFVPDIRKPLDLMDVYSLAEQDVVRDDIQSIRYLNGLAALAVYAGKLDRALEWCDRAENWLNVIGREPVEWELRQAKFTRELRDALRNDRGPEFLTAATSQSTD